VFGRGVELGHELAVGSPGGGEIFALFLELQTQVDGLLSSEPTTRTMPAISQG
jgi:hypothetical protein